jgi:sialate O-acetylesterase
MILLMSRPTLRSQNLRGLAVALLLASCAFADVTLPALLTDHMVVQRGLPVHIWGKADAGEAVSVTFRAATRTATADAVGVWSVSLPPGEAGGPFEVVIKAKNSITLQDVMAGDVWVASGQSNMEWELRNANNGAAEVAAANHPGLRLFRVKNKAADYPLADVEAKPWARCTPESAASFSAVAYFFGRDLEKEKGIVIGLIESAWGGTPADAWTSLRALSSDAALMPVFAEWSKMTDDAAMAKLYREKQLREWQQAADKAKAEGTKPPSYPWSPNMDNSWQPAGLYNAMLAPLTKFPIRGAIWYQGESNAGGERVGLYARLFATMIQDWRRAWGQGDFPFLFVQLANFKTGPNSRWPELREAQTKTLSLANTGMAVSIDIGNPDDIHPRNKQDVGARLAAAARAISYGANIEYSGPLYRTIAPEGAGLRVWFDHVGKGLQAGGGALKGFEIAGADKKFVTADARIDGDTVVVGSAAVTAPVYVRYGWSDNPECTLYNVEGFPASPFRSGE